MQRKIRRQRQRNIQKDLKRWRGAVAKLILPPVAAAGLMLGVSAYGLANPADGTVTAGTGTIRSSGTTTTITQSTDKLAINWQSFSIASGETVNFVQPSSTAIALNRVIGSDPSAIYGTLSANGKVFLINPNGILFSPTAQVNVGGLVTSALNLSDSDFLNGIYTFSGSGGSGAVINQGTIHAADGGYVAILGSQVSNEGVIVARQGTVALGAGNQITLDFNGDGLINLAVDQAALGAQVANKNLIQADGGTVLMTAKAADALAGTVINNSGVIQAQSINNINGEIILDGGTNGTAVNSGTLDASGKKSGEIGSTVKVLGETVALSDGSLVDVSGDHGGGTVLIGGNYQGNGTERHAVTTTVAANAAINADALTNGNGGKVVVWADQTTAFAGTITARGGNGSGNGGNVEVSGKKTLTYQGHSDTTAVNGKTGRLLLDPGEYTISTAATGVNVKNNTELTNELASNNITLATDGTGTGNITVAAPVGWTADTTLTLSANNNIYVNANITASGNNAGLALAYGSGGGYSLGSGAKITLTGTSPTLTIGGNSYTVINASNLASTYSMICLASQSFSLTGYYALSEDIDAGGQTITPIGTSSSAFQGAFDGLGHTISNITITSSGSNIGLFGYTGSTSLIRNLGLSNVTVSGNNNVGGLVGDNYGTITGCSVSSAMISATGNSLGGLAGANESGATISGCSSSGTVNRTTGSGKHTGGLVGWSQGTITDCASIGTVTSVTANTGGLVGWSQGTITDCTSFGTVTSLGANTGGLIGDNWGTITGCSVSSATISATGNSLGGLAGANESGATISGCSSSGTVNRTTGSGKHTGGLVGWSQGTITGCASSGTVTSVGVNTGGLVGYSTNKGVITNCSSTGTVTASGGYVGGLIGWNNGAVSNSHSSSDVKLTSGTATVDSWSVGGLIGYNIGADITGCYATGAVVSNNGSTTYGEDNFYACAGGLVGYHRSGNITGCYSTGEVTSTVGRLVGGLVGWLYSGNVSGCYHTTGAVTGADEVGGLMGGSGWNLLKSNIIEYCYNTAVVKGEGYIGGLCGANYGTIRYSYNTGAVFGIERGYICFGGLAGINYGLLTQCYNVGPVDAAQKSGGVAGNNEGAISSCYWSTDNNAGMGGIFIGTSSGCAGLTLAQMTDAAEFSGWDIATTGGSSIWRIYEGYSYPLLRNFLTPLTVTTSGSKTYDGTAAVGTSGWLSYSLSGVSSALINYDNLTYAYTDSHGNPVTAKNAGTYTVAASGLYSSQQGYDITYATGTLAINPKALTATQAATVTKTYDGTAAATITAANLTLDLSGIIAGDSVGIVSGTGTYASKNAGSRDVTVTGVTLDNSNYNLTADNVAGGTLVGQIDPKALTATQAATVTKTYDGTTAAIISAANLTLDTNSVIDGDSVSVVSSTGIFSSKNAGSRNVTVTGVTLDNSNYTLAVGDVVGGTLTGQIDPKALTATQAATVTKTYDGTTAAIFDNSNLTLNGVVSGDSVNVNGSGTYVDKNAGSGNVTITGVILDNNNYTLSADNVAGGTLTGQIDPKALTATQAATVTKTYDGTAAAMITAANLTLDTSGIIAGDNVGVVSGTGTYDSRNAGSRNVTVTGVTLDNSNYILVADNVAGGTLTGQIDPKALTATQAATVTKTYNGTTTAIFDNSNLTLHGVVGDDSVNVNGSGTYVDKNAGSGNVTITGVILDNNNYTLSADNVAGGTLTGQIDPKALTATQAATVTKTYDGTAAATITAANLTLDTSGIIAGDSVGVVSGTGAYDSRNAGSRNVTVISVTLSNGNYTLSADNVAGGALAGQIDAKALTATQAATVTKTYDGTAAATITAANLTLDTSGIIAGDSVGVVSGTGAYDSRNTGSRNVTVTSVALNNGNYTLVAGGTLAGQIDLASLTITANNATKRDGAANPAFSVTYTGLAAGDTAASLDGTLSFSTTATTASPVGQYAITPAGVSSSNYDIHFAPGILMVLASDPMISAIMDAEQTAGGEGNRGQSQGGPGNFSNQDHDGGTTDSLFAIEGGGINLGAPASNSESDDSEQTKE